jgi:hypothetical protein
LLQKLPPLRYRHGDAVVGSVTIILSEAELRSNPKEYDRFSTKSPPLIRSSQ